MRPTELQIVFDKYPPSAKGKYQLTVGTPYTATLKDDALALYTIQDDAGASLNVSLYGRSYENGGCWHIKGEKSPWDDDDDDGNGESA